MTITKYNLSKSNFFRPFLDQSSSSDLTKVKVEIAVN